MMRTLGLMGFYRTMAVSLSGLCLLLFTGCGDDVRNVTETITTTVTGTTTTDTVDEELPPSGDLPGLAIADITVGVAGTTSGQTRSAGTARAVVGDTLVVTFKLNKGDGTALSLSEMDFTEIIVAGPTSNYQEVLSARDLKTRATQDSTTGVYTYIFEDPLPATVPAQRNDSDHAVASLGELKGQALPSGTYTVGIAFDKEYVDSTGKVFLDNGVETKDFLVGTATTLEPREVVTDETCNQCHTDLYLHGGHRVKVKYCVLCHTSGAEDRIVTTDDPDTAEDETVTKATPGVSIDFRVMIHKIHNGEHLPSVNGVTTDDQGNRVYGTGSPYEVIGFRDSVHDYSHVAFPVWPNLGSGMPRDVGYASLSSDNQHKADEVLTGVTACDKCHGAPMKADGTTGTAPAQGYLAYTKGTDDIDGTGPSRKACGSCHDDIDWAKLYRANVDAMPPQADDKDCDLCHIESGSRLSVRDAHQHPVLNSTLNPGVKLAISAAASVENGTTAGQIDVNDGVSITFTVKNDAGADLTPADDLNTNVYVIVNGPTANPNLLLYSAIPRTALTGTQPYTVNLPERVQLELNAATGTASAGQVVTAGRTPVWTTQAAKVYERTAASGGASTTLSAAASALQNYLDVADASALAKNDYIVIDDGNAGEEYLQVRYVDGNRVWFSSRYSTSTGDYPAALRNAHASGVAVTEITLTSVDFTVADAAAAAAGQITITDAVGSGNKIVISYTTDFVVPAVYGPPLNDAPPGGTDDGLDINWGEWTGQAIEPGNYTVTIWAGRGVGVSPLGTAVSPAPGTHDHSTDNTGYRGTSLGATKTIAVGTSAAAVARTDIVSEASCLVCHTDIYFHGGGRRGLDTCLACHYLAGAEDGAKYSRGGSATPGVTVDFRTMLHKIHGGAHLPSYQEELAKVNKAIEAANPGLHEDEIDLLLQDFLTDDQAKAIYNVVGYGPADHTYQVVGFPTTNGVKECSKCHGSSTAWKAPSDRNHSTAQASASKTRTWAVTCGSCHDVSANEAHFETNTGSDGAEACATCHGAGADLSVETVHRADRHED